jgi:hypothetical protein
MYTMFLSLYYLSLCEKKWLCVIPSERQGELLVVKVTRRINSRYTSSLSLPSLIIYMNIDEKERREEN